MRIRTGQVSSMWIESDRPEMGLTVVCPAALGYTVTVVYDSINAAGHHYLGETLQVDLDTSKITRH